MPPGVAKVKSLLLGLYGYGNQYGVTKSTKDLYWTVRLLIGTFRRQFPEFPFTSIQVNEGFACRPHVDRRNSGPSALVALGKYIGGCLWVHDPVDGTVPLTISKEEGDASAAYRAGVPYCGQSLDVHQNWVTFDGRKLHAVLPFEGERFSLVFYCGPEAAKVPSSVRNELFEAGFDFDWDEASVSSASAACALHGGPWIPRL